MRFGINALSVHDAGGLTFLKNMLHHLVADSADNEYVVFATDANTAEMGLDKLDEGSLELVRCLQRGWIMRTFWEQFVLPVLLQRYKTDVLYAPGNQGPIFPGR